MPKNCDYPDTHISGEKPSEAGKEPVCKERKMLLLKLLSVTSCVFLALAELTPARMDELIQKELATLRPLNTDAFSDLFAPGGEFCVEEGCFKGKTAIKKYFDEAFGAVASATCQVLDSPFYLPKSNKAACRFACTMVFKDRECATDFFHGIVTYEFTNEGLIKRMDDYFDQSDMIASLDPCLPDNLKSKKKM
eukprot:g43935.t1